MVGKGLTSSFEMISDVFDNETNFGYKIPIEDRTIIFVDLLLRIRIIVVYLHNVVTSSIVDGF